MRSIKISSFFLSLIFSLLVCCSFSQIRKVALLDVTARNSETNDAELFSLKHVLKVSGLPFIITTNVDTAKKYCAIMVSSKTETYTFSTPEKDSLISYVNKGGILFSPYMRDPYLYPLFGLSGGGNSSTHYKIIFNTILNDPSFKWLDDTLETTISLGKITYTSVVNTRYYNVSGALTLAKYDNNENAITRGPYGSGYAYALGFTYKNTFLVNQQNRDYDANRSYSNGFEPTSDAVILFLKAALLNHITYLPYLHTSEFDSKSTVIVTHDIDATSSYDTMSYYSQYERDMGIKAQYLITTHYVDDGALSDFYNIFNFPKVQNLLNQGHVLGSHSMGHFPDFDVETTFPIGILGNTTSNYLPYNAGGGSVTTGGSVLGEVETSKNLLNSNFGLQIKTFRAGYLCFNDKLINAIDTVGGYKFNTTFSANDVLTNFPYKCKKNNASDGMITKVWELPMTISDVVPSSTMTIADYPARVLKWLDVTTRNKRNYAPTVLLIHPTRMFKLSAEQSYISGLSSDIFITNMDDYGDYWVARDSIDFNSTINSNTLTITIPNKFLPLPNSISIIVDKGKLLSKIEVKDGNGNPINFLLSDWETNDKILYLQAHPVVRISENFIKNTNALVKVFPNPCTDVSIVELDKFYKHIECTLYDLSGKIIEMQCTEESNYLKLQNHSYSGFYIARVVADGVEKGILKIAFR